MCQNQVLGFGVIKSEYSDQAGYLPSLIRVCAVLLNGSISVAKGIIFMQRGCVGAQVIAGRPVVLLVLSCIG